MRQFRRKEENHSNSYRALVCFQSDDDTSALFDRHRSISYASHTAIFLSSSIYGSCQYYHYYSVVTLRILRFKRCHSSHNCLSVLDHISIFLSSSLSSSYCKKYLVVAHVCSLHLWIISSSMLAATTSIIFHLLSIY